MTGDARVTTAAPLASVIVTAHNAARTIERCLRALAAQRGFAPGELEIVLVDDRSSDGTGDLARALGIPSLRVVRIDQYESPALTARQHALHRGIEAAGGEVLLFTDADGLAAPGWAKDRVERIARGEADVVAGAVAYAADRGAGSRVLGALQTTDAAYYLAGCRVVNSVGASSGIVFGNAALRRDVYERIGGLPAIGFALTEDLEVARAAHAAGFRIAFAPRPAVVFTASDSLGEVVRRAHRTSAGGVSALSVVGAIWLALLPVLVALRLFGGDLWGPWLLARYAVGAAFAAYALLAAGRRAELPAALVYEPVLVATGLAVLSMIVRFRPVEWGGVRYARR